MNWLIANMSVETIMATYTSSLVICIYSLTLNHCGDTCQVEMTNDKTCLHLCSAGKHKETSSNLSPLRAEHQLSAPPKTVKWNFSVVTHFKLLWRLTSVKCANPYNNSICFTTPFRFSHKNNLVKFEERSQVWVKRLSIVFCFLLKPKRLFFGHGFYWLVCWPEIFTSTSSLLFYLNFTWMAALQFLRRQSRDDNMCHHVTWCCCANSTIHDNVGVCIVFLKWLYPSLRNQLNLGSHTPNNNCLV